MAEEPTTSPDAGAPTAGSMLRSARTAQGLHIAALAATLKVPPQKLEALEADRVDALPDPTFARALAQAVCRVLKIDPEPVLARLPQGTRNRLERMEGGLKAPYRDAGRPDVDEPSWLGRPAVWGPALLIIAAVIVLFLPQSVRMPWVNDDAATASSGAASEAVMPPGGLPANTVTVEPTTPAAVPAPAPPAAETSTATAAAPDVAAEAAVPSASAPAADAAAQSLVIRASADSWVQVVDAQQKTLLSRQLRAGEAVTLDEPQAPLRLVVGNVRATQVEFRGRPVDLAARSRDNIARLQLP